MNREEARLKKQIRKNLEEAIQKTIDEAPTEESLGLAHIAKVRSEKFRYNGKDQYQKEQHRNSWIQRKQLDIACIFEEAKTDKITITDGRTKYTAWKTKENLQELLNRFKKAK